MKMLSNKKLFRPIAAVSFAVVIALFLTHVWISAPEKGAVNGTYYNACCGRVRLQDGELLYRNAKSRYDLENMKFGLTAYVVGNFAERGVEPSTSKTAFLFSNNNGRRTFRTVMRGKEYSFAKGQLEHNLL